MKKIGRLLLFVVAVFCMFFLTVSIQAATQSDGYDYILLDYDSFTVEDNWTSMDNGYGYNNGSKTLRAGSGGVTTSAYFKGTKDGEYKVWARAADYPPDPGGRATSIQVNGGWVDQKAGVYVQKDTTATSLVWEWECIGEVYLTKGVVNKMTLHSSNGFSRMDCIILTDNAGYTPTDEDAVEKRTSCLQLSANMSYDASVFPFDEVSYCLNYDGFSEHGSWTVQSSGLDVTGDARDFFFGYFLYGLNNRDIPSVVDAVTKPYILEEGDYYVWARTGSPSESSAKKRSMQLEINGTLSNELGNHGANKPGFAWEKVGLFHFNKGENRIVLKDLYAYFPRLNCIYITKEGSAQPSSYEDTFKTQYDFLNLTADNNDIMTLPAFVQDSSLTPSSTVSISNENITVNFYNVNDGKNSFVQNDVIYKGDKLKSRSDLFVRQLYRYGSASLIGHDRGSPQLQMSQIAPMTNGAGDWSGDTGWGIPNEKMWTNIGKFDASSTMVYNVKGETVKVKLNIPADGYYYGVTRGFAYDANYKRGYTVKVDGSYLKTGGATHYFNTTNAALKSYNFSYNTDPVYLKKGIVEVEMTSFNDAPMRTSFFSLIPAKDTAALDTIIAKLTNYNTAVSLLGGTALENSLAGTVPVTTTGYPHPITYDYVAHVNEPAYGYSTTDLTRMGKGQWLIPVSAEQTATNKVTVNYENDYIKAKEVWELSASDEEPKVTFSFTAKKRGHYSVVVPTHQQFVNSEYEYALAPMQYRGHGIPEKALLITEQYMYTPMVSVSLPEDNSVVSGKPITYGFTFEPSWIENRWVYKDDYEFGASMRGSVPSLENAIQPAIVAPAQGGRIGEFLVGESYAFKFRPIYRTGDWYESFEHVFTDLFEFRDYRENYYHSVTDAILNTSDLMMNDFYGGWDDNNMSFWDMEGRGFTSNSSPLAIVQRYLLSDDEEILRERAIPTIVSTMTRPTHFKSNLSTGGSQAGYVGSSSSWPTKVNNVPSSYFGASVVGGLYEMSNNSFTTAKTASEKLASNIEVETTVDGHHISDLVAMYKFTGDETYLSNARKVADNYLAYMEKNIQSESPVAYSAFAYVSYMPFLSGLIDIYEATGEQKYLDAAEYAGKVVLTLVWSIGMDGDRANEDMILNKNTVGTRPFMKDHNFWWHGEIQWRPGVGLNSNFEPTEVAEVSSSTHPLRQLGFDEIKEEVVPAWVPSRVGIGLEQPSTFYGQSLNMIMSNWAPDMMRLAEYTGNDLFEAASRNAIVGRFGTYPGYYLDRFVTLQMKENYHRESPVDISSVYWHHIPPFMSMIEDFVVAQAWNWSNKQIEFPSIRQQGYAYFNNNQYGHEPGKFFAEDNMWLWIDKDVVNVSSVNADWIAARKDGVMGIALMNASDKALTTEVKLGNKADSDFTGKVRLYNSDGSFKYVDAVNGKFTATIPGHDLVAAILYSEEITNPSFAYNNYTQVADTVTEVTHSDVTGGGFLLQMKPNIYFAHIFVQNTFKDETSMDGVSKIEIEYSFGDSSTTFKVSDSVYPFEKTIEAIDANSELPIHYIVKVYDEQGTLAKTSKKYTLTPMKLEYGEAKEFNGNTILLTGSNVQAQMSDSAPRNSWDHDDYILNDYGFYAQNAEDATVTISVPEDGSYYIYGNMRAGHSTYANNRFVRLSITQNGETQTVTDTSGNAYKFGYSADVQAKNDEIIADDYWDCGLGVMAPVPVRLEKGVAEITFDFGPYGGFDFFLLTDDHKVVEMLEAYRSYENMDIFKFRSSDSGLKAFLEGYMVLKASKPVISPVFTTYNSDDIVIRLSEADLKNSLYAYVHVNGTKLQDRFLVDELTDGTITLSGLSDGDKIQVSVLDNHGNLSELSEPISVQKLTASVRPKTFAHLNTGSLYSSVAAAKQANALPDGYFVLMTQDNFNRDASVANKNDTDLFNGDKSNYYSNYSTTFTKAFSGEFVIPENDDNEARFYQFISSYLRAHNTGEVYTDSRRTQFILIDGKALTEDGLVEWNKGTSYNGTDAYGTNAYVFGSEYPHEFSAAGSTTPASDLSKNYPHSVVRTTAHLWGYSPAVYLEPGVHTVDVYTLGGSNWFNDLIITDDIGYDITKLLYGGLATRGSGWVDNYKNVLKPQYTDFVVPTFNANIQYKAGAANSVLSWTKATDAGSGSAGEVLAYKVEVLDSDNKSIFVCDTFETSVEIGNLKPGASYTVNVTAVDAFGNQTKVSSEIVASASAYSYIIGEQESQIVLNSAMDSSFAGNNIIYIVGYNTATGKLDSIVPYPVSVGTNETKTVTIVNPTRKPSVTYKLFVWNKKLKPLADFVVPAVQ